MIEKKSIFDFKKVQKSGSCKSLENQRSLNDQKRKKTKDAFFKHTYRKQMEKNVNNHLKLEELKRNESMQDTKTTTNRIKNITLRLILRIVGTFFQCLMSLMACITYIVNTYITDPKYENFFDFLEIFYASFFSFDYIWNLFNAKNKVKKIYNI